MFVQKLAQLMLVVPKLHVYRGIYSLQTLPELITWYIKVFTYSLLNSKVFFSNKMYSVPIFKVNYIMLNYDVNLHVQFVI